MAGLHTTAIRKILAEQGTVSLGGETVRISLVSMLGGETVARPVSPLDKARREAAPHILEAGCYCLTSCKLCGYWWFRGPYHTQRTSIADDVNQHGKSCPGRPPSIYRGVR